MNVLGAEIHNDPNSYSKIISVDIETLDNNDDPIKIKLIVNLTKFDIKSFQIEPSWSGVKYTRQQVFTIINKLFPAHCMSLNIGLRDEMKNMVPKLDLNGEYGDEDDWDIDCPGEPDKDSVIQDLVRRNIDLVLENLLLVVKKGRLFSASFVDEQTLSKRILEIFEEYKNIS